MRGIDKYLHQMEADLSQGEHFLLFQLQQFYMATIYQYPKPNYLHSTRTPNGQDGKSKPLSQQIAIYLR